jgi:hypothetical protein
VSHLAIVVPHPWASHIWKNLAGFLYVYLEDTLQSVKSQRAFSNSITPLDVSILFFEKLASFFSLMGICQV